MGKLIYSHNGKQIVKNFEYLVFQDANGLMSVPVKFHGTIILVTGDGLPRDRRMLEFIAKVDPKIRIGLNRLMDSVPDGFVIYLAGLATAVLLLFVLWLVNLIGSMIH